MTEFIYPFDSRQRLRNCEADPTNPTNDIIIPVCMTLSRPRFMSIELIQVEMLGTQRLVEANTNRIYYSTGVIFPDECAFEITTSNDEVIRAILPVTNNPIESIVGATVTTSQPHNLQTGGTFSLDGVEVSDVMIIDDTSFTLPAAPLTTPTILRAEGLQTYPEIAASVEQQLNNNDLKVTFSFRYTDEGFCIKVVRCCDPNIRYYLCGTTCSYLGFGHYGGRVEFTKNKELCGSNENLIGLRYFDLEPANYPSAPELLGELLFQSNRFTITVAQMFLVGAMVVNIPIGHYTPDSLADYIDNQLPAIDVSITRDKCGVCRFVLTSDTQFTLDLTGPMSMAIASTLGFAPFYYSCQSEYVSSIPFACTDGPPCVWSFALTTEHSSTMIVSLSSPAPLTSVVSVNGSTIEYATAHGLSIGDVVTIDGQETIVTDVPSATSITVTLPTITIGTLNYPCCNLSLLLAPRKNNSNTNALLGFPATDQFFTSNTQVAPYSINNRARNWAMVAVEEPIGGSSRIEYLDFKGQTRSNYLGKLVFQLYPTRVLDGFYPMKMTFFSPTIVTKVRLKILNPDGSLYDLHGQEWSGTLRFHSPY